MAGEIQAPYSLHGKTLYATVHNSIGQIWRTDTHVFEAYTTANLANYTVSLTEQGTASQYYVGTFPTQIAAGIYSLAVYMQIGGSAAEGDTLVSTGNLDWSGSAANSLSALTGVAITSNVKKNQALSKFSFLMTDSVNHAPATGKTVTCTRSIDGGAFAAGTLANVTEIAFGIYTVDFLAADLNGNDITLRCTATGCDDTFERLLTQP